MNSCSVSSFPVPSYNLNDEDIIGSDMTLLTTSKLKVKAFHVSFIFGRFYGLMLHLKVCTFSFSELLTWINGRFDCIVKIWKVNEVDWGPSASVPNVLHQATSHFWCKELKSPSPTRSSVGFGLQELSAPKTMPRSQTDFVLGIPHMDGKLRR